MEVYLPLLRKAFPRVRFCPLEINKGPVEPYWSHDRAIEVLPSLEARHPSDGYQFVTLDI
jgi:hypothetical protein